MRPGPGAGGNPGEVERELKRLAGGTGNREDALCRLVDLYLRQGRTDDAMNTLFVLNGEFPDSLGYAAALAGLLEQSGRIEAALGLYERLLSRRPEMAEAHYNAALLYRRLRRYEEAIASYQRSLALGMPRAEEAWSNLGVLYAELRRPQRAEQMYLKALDLAPDYQPALFNLAGLREEAGAREQARELYERLLEVRPDHHEALARLAWLKPATSGDTSLLERLEAAARQAGGDPLGQEALWFAIGKVLDDLGRYGEAFSAYRRANELGSKRALPYEPAATEKAFDRLAEVFDRTWLSDHETAKSWSPVFICGMFRSGSTLLEQMLSAHPGIDAGGELDFLPLVVARRLAPYPDAAATCTRLDIETMAAEYERELRRVVPGKGLVTDKRPDNFMHLAVARAMFPRARIVVTRRERRDNCLSLYFQQLGNNLGYATDLAHADHYYGLHERLLGHWLDLFGASLLVVDYENLVERPDKTLRRVLDHLGLAWDERCLDFAAAANPAKTASVWQVREGLHRRSIGRWKHYPQA